MSEKKFRNKTGNGAQLIYGKVPPQAKDLEEAVLGAIMLEGRAFSIAKDVLRSECFYLEAHRIIFQSMCEMDQLNMPIDLLTVVEHLRNKELLDKVGGPYAVTKLTNSVVSSANLETHSRIIFQKWLKRVAIQFSTEILSEAYEDGVDAFEIVEKMIALNDAVINRYMPNHRSFDSIVFETVDDILNHDGSVKNGVPTGFSSLDSIIDFFVNGLLYVIAARPSMGKTAFMVQLVENLTKELDKLYKNKPEELYSVGFMELETHDKAFVHRMLANKSGIDSRKFKTGHLNDQERESVSHAGDYLINKKIVCDFTPVSTISEIRVKAKTWKNKFGIKILLIDYLQYVEADDPRLPRERQVATISKGLAGLSKELGIPIIAFAQLNREVYKRADKRPIMSDLRETGSIEQDARCIMFLHRPEYYGEIEDPVTNESTKGITEVIIAKNNEGDTGKIRLYMHKEQSRFEETEPEIATVISETFKQGQLPGNWDGDAPF